MKPFRRPDRIEAIYAVDTDYLLTFWLSGVSMAVSSPEKPEVPALASAVAADRACDSGRTRVLRWPGIQDGPKARDLHIEPEKPTRRRQERIARRTAFARGAQQSGLPHCRVAQSAWQGAIRRPPMFSLVPMTYHVFVSLVNLLAIYVDLIPC